MPATLVVTAAIAVAIRAATNTEMEAQPPPKPLPPFTRSHYIAWGAPSNRIRIVLSLSQLKFIYVLIALIRCPAFCGTGRP